MPAQTHPSTQYLLTDLLRPVSRSFYLTLRVLPAAIRTPIGLAYLLARATDTIADTGLVPIEARLEALNRLRRRILGESNEPLEYESLSSQQASPAEKILLDRINDILAVFSTCQTADRDRIREVLIPITRGQELDLIRFSGSSPSQPIALASIAELDEYTYLVAGCVGEFWTRTCLAHLEPKPQTDSVQLLKDAIRFGKGLQLVNILRDIPADLRNGRCYIPTELLRRENLTARDLLSPAQNENRFRRIYDPLLEEAERHLAAGWRYTCALPSSWRRVRLGCAWPVLIGQATLKRLRTAPVLNPDNRIKIDRKAVRRIMLRTILELPFKARWEKLPEILFSGPSLA